MIHIIKLFVLRVKTIHDGVGFYNYYTRWTIVEPTDRVHPLRGSALLFMEIVKIIIFIILVFLMNVQDLVLYMLIQ